MAAAKFGSKEHREKLSKGAAKGREARTAHGTSPIWAIRVPVQLRKWVEQRAAALGVPASEYVRVALIVMLEHGRGGETD